MDIKTFFLKAIRTSEFWTILAQIVIEAMSAPVPAEYKAMAWVYVVLRVASKLAQQLPKPTEGKPAEEKK